MGLVGQADFSVFTGFCSSLLCKTVNSEIESMCCCWMLSLIFLGILC